MQVCTCDVCGAKLEVHEDDFIACEPAEDMTCPVCKSDVILAIVNRIASSEKKILN